MILSKIPKSTDNNWVQALQSLLENFGESVIKQLNLDYDVTVEQVFQSSKHPLIVIKRNNDVIFAIIKKLITTQFDKKGIFETLTLSLTYWHKLKISNLRSLLHIDSGQDDDPNSLMRKSIHASI
jgi:hypothetical protein